MFNFYPINMAILFVLLAPSVFYEAEKQKKRGDGEKENPKPNKTLLLLEKTGRWGVMVFFCVKYEAEKHEGLLSYLIPCIFLLLYLLVWLILWKKPSKARSVLLSLLPGLMFLSSAVIDSNYILLLFTLMFVPSHLLVSIKEGTAE